MAYFQGPQKYIKKHKVLRNIKNPTIESAEFVFYYITYEIHESNFQVVINENTDKCNLYYRFNYFDETQTNCYGRIYDLQFPIEKLRNIPATNIFEYTHNGYEMDDHEYTVRGPATFRVTFTPKAAAILRAL